MAMQMLFYRARGRFTADVLLGGSGRARSRMVVGLESGRGVAVVVTYHPDAEVLQNLAVLSRQIGRIVLVDNGSDAVELDALRGTGAALMENGRNLGIAAALNQGVKRAQEMGAEWVLLFDQDSAVTEGYVRAMLECFAQGGEKLAILVPRYLDRRFGSVLEAPRGAGKELQAATTSGSLMPLAIFPECGWFAEELFIDGVDYEYSLRVRARGFWIGECAEATLLHSPGTPTFHRLWGGKPFQVANYSAARRYYQERNKIWVTRRYWRGFARFCAGQFVVSVKDLLKILLVEQGKWKKVRYFARGVRDGVRERMGPDVLG